jgi:hypothetical protein
MSIENEEYTGPYAIGDQYAKVVFKPFAIGSLCQDRLPHQPDGVWCVDLNTFHADLKAIDPKAYFITSGEATIKATKLCEDLKAAHLVAKRLLVILKSLKSDAKYLETQWESDRLLLKKKNPRPSSRNSQRKIGNVRKTEDDVRKTEDNDDRRNPFNQIKRTQP